MICETAPATVTSSRMPEWECGCAAQRTCSIFTPEAACAGHRPVVPAVRPGRHARRTPAGPGPISSEHDGLMCASSAPVVGELAIHAPRRQYAGHGFQRRSQSCCAAPKGVAQAVAAQHQAEQLLLLRFGAVGVDVAHQLHGGCAAICWAMQIARRNQRAHFGNGGVRGAQPAIRPWAFSAHRPFASERRFPARAGQPSRSRRPASWANCTRRRSATSGCTDTGRAQSHFFISDLCHCDRVHDIWLAR